MTLPDTSFRLPSLATPAQRLPGRPGAVWIERFIAFQLVCALALIVPGIETARTACRVAAFGASLGMLALAPRGGPGHPSLKFAACVVLVLLLGFAHPDTRSPLAAAATVAMYAAVLAPLVWAGGLGADARQLRRVVVILWGFHTTSAAVGVLQVAFPGSFQPEPSAVFLARGDAMVEGAKITLASGARVFRPMGLSDLPGGAANSGLACIVFGLGIWLAQRRAAARLAALASVGCGLFVIYLSHVRSILVMAIIAILVLGAILVRRRDRRGLARYVALIALALVVSTGAAVWVGGEETVARLRTLVEDDPATVYYYNRGHYLHETLLDLPRYPLGAGLGRWGMIHHYFAGARRGGEEPLWAEVQWTAWVYDGGLPLALAYAAAAIVAVRLSWKFATSARGGHDELVTWSAVVCAGNVAALAVTFNYPIFMSQGGMEFWLLNACLWSAWTNHRRQGGLDATRGTR